MTKQSGSFRTLWGPILALSILWGIGVMLAVGQTRASSSGFTNAAATQQGRRPLELNDYYRIETADSPALSPDGRFVAFVRTYILENENRRHSEIWLASTDGSSAPKRLTSPSFSSSNPRWSPDGTLLAFASRRPLPGSDRDAPSSVWFLRMDQVGGEAFQIPGLTGPPIFSPDNQWIAFAKRTPPEKKPAKEPASDFERKVKERFKGRIYDWMNYRFDGRGYLPDPRDPDATPPDELYVLPRAGGTPRQLTRLGVSIQAAHWRPDSRALVLLANTYERDEYVYERADLWTLTLEGQLHRLTDDGYNHSTPTWSPDGRWLAFRRGQSLNQVIESKQNHGSPVDVFRMPAAGGQMENLTANWELIPGSPTWSADGRHLYFSAGVRGNSHLFRVAASAGDVEMITRGDRRLGDFSFSRAFDRMAYSATDPTHPSEVFTASINGSGERKLASFSDALLTQIELSRVERIVYPSKDGTQIEGWVMLPRGYDPAKGPYPLILTIHGGPHGAYGNAFSGQLQQWAANGYVVLYTNPRGSTEYGEKFLWATWGGWGLLDYDDVMAGVDQVVKRYAIDEKRMGVTGYSYGGFLTNLIITHSSRFAAAISGAGVSNWVSDYGTADIPRTKETEFYGPPWEPRSSELMRKLSPVFYAANATTPTLFVHGELDLRVPAEQAEQMYMALKKRKVPAMFIRYPDSYHGGWTPWNTVHRMHEELKWWDKHLRKTESLSTHVVR